MKKFRSSSFSSSATIASILLYASFQDLYPGSLAFTITPYAKPSILVHRQHFMSPTPSSGIDNSIQINNDKDDNVTSQHSNGKRNSKDFFTKLPRHRTKEGINQALIRSEKIIQKLYEESSSAAEKELETIEEKEDGLQVEKVFANSYVDLGNVDTVGFDYDYTLVTYTDELLDLIYDMTLNRLVKEYQYPLEMLDAKLKFDPSFSIRGLAVDRETAWICHLSYTHKVAVAYEGRMQVSRERVIEEYRGKRSLNPTERKKRLKPLNDLFSMAECCLIADVVQFFHENNIPFCPKNAVVDILDAIGRTHISGDFHRIVANNPKKVL